MHKSLLIGNSDTNTMKKLTQNWFIEPVIDFEMKSYILLGWLKSLEEDFQKLHFFPFSEELNQHIKNLENYLDGKSKLFEGSKQILLGFNSEKNELEFKDEFLSHSMLDEIDKIVEWSLQKLKITDVEFNNLLNKYSSAIQIEPVGIEPLYRKEGYLFIPQNSVLSVYEYQLHELFSNSDDESYNLNTTLIGTYKWSQLSTCENLKIELSKSQNKFPVPATYFCECKYELPLEASLLPLAKKKLSTFLMQ